MGPEKKQRLGPGVEGVKVGEILFTRAVEIDVGIAAARPGRWNVRDRRRRRLLCHDAEGVASVHRPEPCAPLGAGPGRTGTFGHGKFWIGKNRNARPFR